MGRWIVKHDPSDTLHRRTHACIPPQRVYNQNTRNAKVPGASVGDLYQCECTEIWKIARYAYSSHQWKIVGGVYGLWLRLLYRWEIRRPREWLENSGSGGSVTSGRFRARHCMS